VGDVQGIFVIGLAASAGGLEPIKAILERLPRHFPGAILVVLHRGPDFPGQMERLLARWSPLSVKSAATGERPRPGTVLVAPAHHHVHVSASGSLVVTYDDRPRAVRPSADHLFASMARELGSQACAVVLSGHGWDGAEGCRAIRRHGGLVLVQDPAECVAPSMSRSVLAHGGADFVLPAAAIADALVSLTLSPTLLAGLFGVPRRTTAPERSGGSSVGGVGYEPDRSRTRGAPGVAAGRSAPTDTQ
jgi:two-component system chemotaxis response regulator CheB